MQVSTAEQSSGLVHLAKRAASGLQHLFSANVAMFCWTVLLILSNGSPALCSAICHFLQQHLIASISKQTEAVKTEDTSLIEKAIKDSDAYNWVTGELQEMSGDPTCASAHTACGTAGAMVPSWVELGTNMIVSRRNVHRQASSEPMTQHHH